MHNDIFARRMHGQYEGFIVKTSSMKHAVTTFGWLQKKMKLATTEKNRYHRREECRWLTALMYNHAVIILNVDRACMLTLQGVYVSVCLSTLSCNKFSV